MMSYWLLGGLIIAALVGLYLHAQDQKSINTQFQSALATCPADKGVVIPGQGSFKCVALLK